MPEVSLDQLETAIVGMHRCKAVLRAEVPVHEEFDGKPMWEGVVYVFDVNHPEASTCYAWSAPVEGSYKRKFYAILGIPPINSAVAAVKASIKADRRAK